MLKCVGSGVLCCSVALLCCTGRPTGTSSAGAPALLHVAEEMRLPMAAELPRMYSAPVWGISDTESTDATICITALGLNPKDGLGAASWLTKVLLDREAAAHEAG